MPILKVEGVTKLYKDVKALDAVTFEFERGILSFLGPSGCGKTTLLRSIAGLEVPDAGSIAIADKVQTSIERGIFWCRRTRARSVLSSRITRCGRI
jgi:ABC-type Fe3+/spermidine/putrescine transport system ATPase subunit